MWSSKPISTPSWVAELQPLKDEIAQLQQRVTTLESTDKNWSCSTAPISSPRLSGSMISTGPFCTISSLQLSKTRYYGHSLSKDWASVSRVFAKRHPRHPVSVNSTAGTSDYCCENSGYRTTAASHIHDQPLHASNRSIHHSSRGVSVQETPEEQAQNNAQKQFVAGNPSSRPFDLSSKDEIPRPDAEYGRRLLDVYKCRVHHLHPFLDMKQIAEGLDWLLNPP